MRTMRGLVVASSLSSAALGGCAASNHGTRTLDAAEVAEPAAEPAGADAAPTPVAATAANPAKSPLLVFLNGWGTCGGILKRFNGPAFKMADTLRDQMHAALGQEVAYVYSCYSAQDELFVGTSASPKIQRIDAVGDLVGIIKTTLAGDLTRPVYVVGHSYGGWTAMKTVGGLAPDLKVMSLTTSDPISRADCRPNMITAAMAGGANAKPAAECVRAPQDLNAAAIKANVGIWHNFYQNDFPLLHSSVIPQADANQLLQIPHLPFLKFQAHPKMAQDDRIWADAHKNILGN